MKLMNSMKGELCRSYLRELAQRSARAEFGRDPRLVRWLWNEIRELLMGWLAERSLA